MSLMPSEGMRKDSRKIVTYERQEFSQALGRASRAPKQALKKRFLLNNQSTNSLGDCVLI
ncbi:hypothetical protein YC2023_077398 [Brassica napus]